MWQRVLTEHTKDSRSKFKKVFFTLGMGRIGMTEVLLVNQTELEFVIITMSTKWLNTMNHVGNIVIVCPLSR